MYLEAVEQLTVGCGDIAVGHGSRCVLHSGQPPFRKLHTSLRGDAVLKLIASRRSSVTFCCLLPLPYLMTMQICLRFVTC